VASKDLKTAQAATATAVAAVSLPKAKVDRLARAGRDGLKDLEKAKASVSAAERKLTNSFRISRRQNSVNQVFQIVWSFLPLRRLLEALMIDI
jgi:hypothetical protein